MEVCPMNLVRRLRSVFPVVAVAFAMIDPSSAQQVPDNPNNTASSRKPKKVITNDDLQSSGPDLAATDKAAAAKRASVPKHPATDANGPSANNFRGKLEKLNGQLKSIEAQIAELQRFQAGETNGTAGRQLHEGYNMEPIPEQIEKLKTKRAQVQTQINETYDQARQKGIAPGELR
jgi:hypothetical protein